MTQRITVLNGLLSDLTVMYQRTRGYHWTVTGQHFFELHKQFERLYKATGETIDLISERVVALGGHPVWGLREVIETSRMGDDVDSADAGEMVHAIITDLERLAKSTADAARVCEQENDRATAHAIDELTFRLEKDAWMFRAFLGQFQTIGRH